MDKKSFFRGFGVGVLFTAIILGISFTVRTSESFVKQRAVKLGMIYPSEDSKTVLSAENESSLEAGNNKESSSEADNVTDTSGENTDEKEKEKSKSQDSSAEKKKASAKKDTEKTESSKENSNTKGSNKKKKTSSKSTDMKKEKEKLEKSTKSEMKKLTINAGEWSTTVSEKLERLGIIDDAKAFDRYLDKNGFSSSISAGTYKVSVDDTYNELARKITKR